MTTFGIYDFGEEVELTVRFFSDAEHTTPADPDDVVLTLRDPAGGVTTPTSTHVDVGVWTYAVTPTASGLYEYDWAGTGDVVSAEEGVFFVRESVTSDEHLCRLADVRVELEMSDTETGRDVKITSRLPDADRIIQKWCSREFLPGGVATRKFAYYGGGRLDLSPYDLQSATVVAIDTDTTSPLTLVASTDYYFEPLPNPDGVFTHLLIPALQPTDNGLITRREVSITGTWGFPSVPGDVKRAAVLTIAGWLDKAVNEYGNNADGDARQGAPGVGSGYQLSLGVKAILSDYRRKGIA